MARGNPSHTSPTVDYLLSVSIRPEQMHSATIYKWKRWADRSWHQTWHASGQAGLYTAESTHRSGHSDSKLRNLAAF